MTEGDIVLVWFEFLQSAFLEEKKYLNQLKFLKKVYFFKFL